MEWLKAILEKAEIKDGKLDVDAVMNAAQKEFPKYAVPKEDFNTKVEALQTANGTIEELKKSNGDNEALQKKIGDYEIEIKNLKKNAENTSKTYALKESLTKQGVLDPDYLIYKAGGLDKFTFDKEGKPVQAGAAEAAISSEWWKRRQWQRQSICQRNVQSDQTGRTFKNQPRAGESDGRSRWGNNLINLRR